MTGFNAERAANGLLMVLGVILTALALVNATLGNYDHAIYEQTLAATLFVLVLL